MSTPLVVAPAGRGDLAFLKDKFDGESVWGVTPDNVESLFNTTNQTLMRRLFDTDIDDFAIKKLGGFCAAMESISDDDLTNALLIGGKIISNGDLELIEQYRDFDRLPDIAIGMYQNPADNQLNKTSLITTEEELAACASAASFILIEFDAITQNKPIVRSGFKHFSPTKIQSFCLIRNRHLSKLLLERPDDMHAITNYVRERGIHPINKRPVEAIRAYLEDTSSVPAFGSGWI